MATESSKAIHRNRLAYLTVGFTLIGLSVLIGTVILSNPSRAMDVFNVVLPMVASWVGTILAFYFGRENFETANRRVMEIVQKITPERRAKHPIKHVMRPLGKMIVLHIPRNKTTKDYTLAELKQRMAGEFSRLPIVDENNCPKYMVHNSSVNQYLVNGGQVSDTLETFLESQQQKGKQYDLGSGFVVVSEDTALSIAKNKLEQQRDCQDIFITEDGSESTALLGWASNMRLFKFLDA